ncbi:hypothetical protein ACE01N_20250 [Saccharicrinis sp. FJH2]|uniref:hypothetical protein n=1 Tax=Saccharicrinis sp. FJH65 TaxID=3344659 RepID=UPI0035F22B66
MKSSRFIILCALCGLIIFFGFRKFKIYQTNKIINRYSRIETYNDAKKLFESDLEKNDLKYFFFGQAYNTNFDSIKKKYDLKVIFMGDIIDQELNMYNHIIEKEILKKSPWNHSTNKADSIWSDFMNALETRQINYLLVNSFDTIICSELSDSLKNSFGDRYEAKFIFENHLDELMHLKNLSTQNWHVYNNDSIIRIHFTIKCKAAEEGAYDLIFMFDKNENKYLFSGMITT